MTDADVSAHAEALRMRRQHFIRIAKLQTLLRRLVANRFAHEQSLEAGLTVSELGRRIGSNWNRMDSLLAGTSAVTNRVPYFVQLLDYARGAPEADQLPESDRALLRQAETIFRSEKMSDREYALCMAPKAIITLYFDLRETQERFAPGQRTWIFARAFGEDEGMVRELLDLRVEGFAGLCAQREGDAPLNEAGNRVLDLICDEARLTGQLQAVIQALKDQLTVYADGIRALCKALKPRYEDTVEVSKALGARASLVKESCVIDPNRVTLRKACEVFLQVADLAERTGTKLPDELRELIRKTRSESNFQQEEGNDGTPEPEVREAAEKADGTDPADLHPENPAAPEQAPITVTEELQRPPAAPSPQAPEPPTCDAHSLLRLMDTEVLLKELRDRLGGMRPEAPPRRPSTNDEAVLERAMGGIEPLLDIIELAAPLGSRTLNRQAAKNLAYLAKRLLKASGADRDPTIAEEAIRGLGTLRLEDLFYGGRT